MRTDLRIARRGLGVRRAERFGEVVWVSLVFFFFTSRRRHTRCGRDWSSDVCSSDLSLQLDPPPDRRQPVPRHPQIGALAVEHEIEKYLQLRPHEPDQVILLPQRDHHVLERVLRSEERRVGKEGRSRWSPYH